MDDYSIGTNADNLSTAALAAHVIRASSLSCPACNYDLSGVREPRCSECGVPLQLRLIDDDGDPPRWHFVVLVGLALIIAISFTLTCYAIATSSSRPNPVAWLPPFVLLIFSAATLVFWIRNRGIITRSEAAKTVLVGTLVWISVAAILIVGTLVVLR